MLTWFVFVCGATLMGLEIVASRVLAPTFGNSIYVWGSLISIFLAALSIGYYWGGALSDRTPKASVLSLLVAVPALLITALPYYAGVVNAWFSTDTWDPRWGPLLASSVLFLVPSLFLGTVSPYAIKLKAKSIETVGKTAGRLYAVSTAGSIVGTLATAFFLIPAMGVSNILHTLGAVLLVHAGLPAVSSINVENRLGQAGKCKPNSGKR